MLTVSDIGNVKQEGSNTSFIPTTSFDYLLGKYDATKAGALVWYVGGLPYTEYTLPDSYNDLGLSHISAFTAGLPPSGPPPAIPEPTTMLLFGTGLIGLAALSRRRNK